MTAWSSAFDSGVARPLVYSKSISLIENVFEGEILKFPPHFRTSVEDPFNVPATEYYYGGVLHTGCVVTLGLPHGVAPRKKTDRLC